MTARGIIGFAAVVVAVAVAGTAVWATRAHADRVAAVAISPAEGRTVGPTTPILISVDPATVADIRIALDGKDLTTAAMETEAGFELRGLELTEGRHIVTVEVVEDGIFGGTARARSSFDVDATAPPLAIDGKAVWSTDAALRGRSEPGAVISVQWQSGRDTTTAAADGTFAITPPVPEGRSPLVIRASDEAGNTASVRRPLLFDATEPVLGTDAIPDWVTETDRPTLEISVDDVGPVTTEVRLNGEIVETAPTATGVRLRTGRLAQGVHTLTVRAEDGAGNRATLEREFGVDSTERLTNDLTLRPGAKGRDVARLTRRLKLEGFYKGKPSWKYDAKVERAVRAYQASADLPVDGIARPALLQQTAGRIVIDQSDYTLTLFLDGKKVKTYPIAVGTASYPTPNGTYTVTEMIRNPTWFPPNSPWAAGLEPVPPGASNPLGTRWIGTSASLIGIHGTPKSWSIRSRASHGCIRMYIGDVEELFEQVLIGMPVEIKP